MLVTTGIRTGKGEERAGELLQELPSKSEQVLTVH